MVSPKTKYEFRIHKGFDSSAVIEKKYELSEKEYNKKYKFWKKFVEEELGDFYTFIASKL